MTSKKITVWCIINITYFFVYDWTHNWYRSSYHFIATLWYWSLKNKHKLVEPTWLRLIPCNKNTRCVYLPDPFRCIYTYRIYIYIINNMWQFPYFHQIRLDPFLSLFKQKTNGTSKKAWCFGDPSKKAKKVKVFSKWCSNFTPERRRNFNHPNFTFCNGKVIGDPGTTHTKKSGV